MRKYVVGLLFLALFLSVGVAHATHSVDGYTCQWAGDLNSIAPVTLQDGNASIQAAIPDTNKDGWLRNSTNTLTVPYYYFDGNIAWNYDSAIGLNLRYFWDCDTNYSPDTSFKVSPALSGAVNNDVNAYDFYENGTRGATTNNITYSTNRVSGQTSAVFNGTSSYVVYPLSWLTDSNSFEADVYPYKNNADQTIFIRNNWDVVLRITAAGGWLVSLGNDTICSIVTGGGIVDVNHWYHVAVTWGAQGTKLYVNGNLLGSCATTLGYTDNGDFIVVGARESLNAVFYNGLIDNVRFYNFQVGDSNGEGLMQADLNLFSKQPFANISNVSSGAPENTPPVVYNGTTIKLDGELQGTFHDGNHNISFQLYDADSNQLRAKIYVSSSQGNKQTLLIDANLFTLQQNPSADYNCTGSGFYSVQTCNISWGNHNFPDGNYFIDVNVYDSKGASDFNSSANSFKISHYFVDVNLNAPQGNYYTNGIVPIDYNINTNFDTNAKIFYSTTKLGLQNLLVNQQFSTLGAKDLNFESYTADLNVIDDTNTERAIGFSFTPLVSGYFKSLTINRTNIGGGLGARLWDSNALDSNRPSTLIGNNLIPGQTGDVNITFPNFPHYLVAGRLYWIIFYSVGGASPDTNVKSYYNFGNNELSYTWLFGDIQGTPTRIGMNYLNDVYMKLFISQTSFSTNSFDWNSSTASDGNYFIDINSISKIMDFNDSSSSNYPLGIDSTAPTTTDDHNAGWQNFDANVILDCTDAGIGCSTTQYRINSGTWETYDGNILISTDGNFRIDYNSTDGLGNIETTVSIWVAIDKTAPSVSDNYPGVSYVTFYVSLSCSDATSGCSAIYYALDTDANDTESYGSWELYLSPIEFSTDGNFGLKYYGVDNAANNSATTTIFVIAMTAPPDTNAGIFPRYFTQDDTRFSDDNRFVSQDDARYTTTAGTDLKNIALYGLITAIAIIIIAFYIVFVQRKK